MKIRTQRKFTENAVVSSESPFEERLSLREKCLYSEFFRSAVSRIRTKYGEILRISLYSTQMRGNADQKKSEYGHFSRNVFQNLSR